MAVLYNERQQQIAVEARRLLNGQFSGERHIAGGADEMLLNRIAVKILDLPQDHRPTMTSPSTKCRNN